MFWVLFNSTVRFRIVEPWCPPTPPYKPLYASQNHQSMRLEYNIVGLIHKWPPFLYTRPGRVTLSNKLRGTSDRDGPVAHRALCPTGE